MSPDALPPEPAPPENAGEIVLYRTEDGRTRLECRFVGQTLWLTQALIAELFGKDVRTVNEHLQNVYTEGELDPGATIRKFRIVRREGGRDVAREIEHYSLDAILAVGYRVRSPRGTQFRQWATARLKEFLVKGFVLDDERMKNPPWPRTTCARTRSPSSTASWSCSSTTPRTRPGAASRSSSRTGRPSSTSSCVSRGRLSPSLAVSLAVASLSRSDRGKSTLAKEKNP